MMPSSDATRPVVVPVRDNLTPLWGMSSRERVRRMAVSRGLRLGDADETRSAIVVNLEYAFDPAWLRWIEERPGTALASGGTIVLAHVPPVTMQEMPCACGGRRSTLPMSIVAAESVDGVYDRSLRKRERPFVERLAPHTVDAIERASYDGAYKGVTDLLTAHLWRGLAFHLTRLAARVGLAPTGVTAIGSLLCALATIAFWHGNFWVGLAAAFGFMILDTVDGKLARCTMSATRLGHLWDHGVDLIHPPIWWWAWAAGCASYGRPLGDGAFWTIMSALLIGYVAQRLIEGAFIVRHGMHIHVWKRFDSRFRLFTARRNPNMLILLLSMLAGRPDVGIAAVGLWTMLSLAVHAVRLRKARVMYDRGLEIVSWLDVPSGGHARGHAS